MKNQKILTKYLFLLLASSLLYFTGFHHVFFLAAWIPMIFFIYYFRNENKWYEYIIFLLLLLIPKFFTIHGAWHGMSIFLELFATLFAISPLIFSLLADKFLYKKSNTLVSTLIFPATYVLVDFLIGLSPLFGTFSSLAITQFNVKPLIQIASITGFEGVSFLIMWFSSTIAILWWKNFNLKKEKTTAIVFISVFCGIFLLGGMFYTLSAPSGSTVRVAGISVEHKTDYWNIIDMNTPKEVAQKYSDEIYELQENLFIKSEKAANFGAKIIFWSEANAVIYDEERETFLKKSQDFAKNNSVYFAPAFLVLKYDTYSAENKILMINPEGKIEFEYEKTISWYPSRSDGIIDTLETPYGKIASVICYDADFPRFIIQAGKKNVDILLNPKFDTKLISPGHTYSGLYRAVENGFSMVSQVQDGISIATDYRGNVLAYQDYFNTEDRTMIIDIPIKGRKTIYSTLGDWFIYLNALFLVLLIILRFKKLNLKKRKPLTNR